MQITMENSRVNVINANDGSGLKIIHVADQAGNVIIIPLPPEAARTIGSALSASVLVATQPLPTGNGNG